MSMDDSVKTAPRTIMMSPGISPSCFTAAGRAMIPAPTIVEERLKTAPEYDAQPKPTSRSSCFWGRRRGVRGLRRYFRSVEGRIVIFEELAVSRERVGEEGGDSGSVDVHAGARVHKLKRAFGGGKRMGSTRPIRV
ncbi:hypothetical protein FH972_013729 [Carpinus fangiana]|uniref:Uncharacterized protein n=1 Tax=Carpinus fangiana TaxID=176857 RepID=A0A5N6RA72_9ROSI|nr:hypothetical protein FH972_013729 [Carpinus fangiana]